MQISFSLVLLRKLPRQRTAIVPVDFRLFISACRVDASPLFSFFQENNKSSTHHFFATACGSLTASQAGRGVRHPVGWAHRVPELDRARASHVALWQQGLVVVRHLGSPGKWGGVLKTANRTQKDTLDSPSHPWYVTVRPATSALSQCMKTWTHSRQKAPNEAAMDTLAAPMTPSLKRFKMKPPVMMPSATAGRFRIPGRKQKRRKY